MTYQIDLQIDPAVSSDLPSELSPEWFRDAVARVLVRLGEPEGTEVSLLVTTDVQIRELNRGFRNTDAPTDVLAFSAREGEGFITPPDLPPYLGDVAISLNAAARQAAERGHPLRSEMALLVVHGCLHLLGYDHATPEQRRAMWALQAQLLQELGIEPPDLDDSTQEATP